MKILFKFGLAGMLIMLLSAAGPLLEISGPILVAAEDTGAPAVSHRQDTDVVSQSPIRPALLTSPLASASPEINLPEKPLTMAMVVAPRMSRNRPTPMITAAMPRDPASMMLPAPYVRTKDDPQGKIDSRQLLPNPNLSAFGLPCNATLTVEPAPDDLLAISFKAPCLNQRQLTLSAGKIVLNITTDIFGHYATQLPQLTQITEISIQDRETRLATALITVDQAPTDEAYVLIWQNRAPLGIFVRSNDLALRRDAGKLGLIKNPKSPRNLSYFTAPAGFQSIRFSLVGTVDAQNCDQVARARLLHRSTGGIDGTDLQFRMPGCDQLGKTLELRSVIPDMKMARN